MRDTTTLDTLVQRLEEFRHRMDDNAALDYCGAQIADELSRILVEVDTMRLVDEYRTRQQKSPAELQLDEGRGNYVDAGAGDEPTGGGRDE